MPRKGVALLAVAVLLGLLLGSARSRLHAPFMVNPTVDLPAQENFHLSAWVSIPPRPKSELFVQAVEELIATFTGTWTNVAVTTTFIPEPLLQNKLRDALGRGEPPDVLVNSAASPADYGALQVPLGFYLSTAEKERFPPAIIAQLSARGVLATLPLGYTFRAFAANPASFRAAGIDIEQYVQDGWSWDAFFAAVDTLSRRHKRGLALTNVHLPLLRNLAASLGKPTPFTKHGQLTWSNSELQTIGETARRLGQAAKVNPEDTIEADEDALVSFLRGQVGLVGPLNPELTRWLLSAAKKQGLSPLLLPVPSLGPIPVADIAAVSVVLFRQASFRGHRHTRAAAELAKHISEKAGPIFNTHLALLTHQQDRTVHLNIAGVEAAYANLSLAPATPYSPYWEAMTQQPSWEEALLPLWLRLLNGELSPIEFTAEGVRALRQLENP